MTFKEKEKKFDPKKVYKDQQNQQNYIVKFKTKNVFGEPLELCLKEPLTGWYRDDVVIQIKMIKVFTPYALKSQTNFFCGQKCWQRFNYSSS